MSRARQETPMFPARAKPAHVGVYRTDADSGNAFQHWNGRWWGWNAENADQAAAFKRYRSGWQNVRWCGLAQQPKVAP